METVIAGVHRIGGGYVNSYLVDGDQGVVLIDTGLPNSQAEVIEALRSLGRGPSDITAIVLTHSHTDHIGGAAVLKTGSGARVIAPRIDTPAIQGEEPIPAPPLLIGPLKYLSRLMPSPTPVTVDASVSEGSPAGIPEDFTVIDTPGHTPGHTSYLLDRRGGILFVGDAASNKDGSVTKGLPNAGGGRRVDASIRHLAEFEFEVAVFGHAAPLMSGAAEAFRGY